MQHSRVDWWYLQVQYYGWLVEKLFVETHLIAAKVEWKLSCLRSNFFGSWWPWWGKNIERDCLLETRPLVTVRSNLYQPWMACKMNLMNGNWDIQSNIFYHFNREFFKILGKEYWKGLPLGNKTFGYNVCMLQIYINTTTQLNGKCECLSIWTL